MSDSLYQYRAELEGRKKGLEAELKATKSEIASVGDMVLEDFAERGATSMKLVTGETVFMHTQPRASVKAGDWAALESDLKLASLVKRESAQNKHEDFLRDDYAREAGKRWGVNPHVAKFLAPDIAGLYDMGRWQVNLNTLTAWAKERIDAFNERAVGMADDEIERALKGPTAPLPGPLADLITLIVKPTVRVRGAKAQASDAGGGGVARINPESIANLAGQDGVIMDMGNKE